jgi:polysaccharide export outer membrane protein
MQSTAELDGWGEYSVGPGDVLVISVWKEPDVTSTVVVRTDGKISLPLVRDLYVDGMTPVAITKLVVEKLTPLINDPIVTVTVNEIHSKVIYVIGEVGRPGPYPVTRPMTVLQILTQAGGLSEFAKKKSVYVLRENNGRQEKLPFNYADVVNGKNMQQNILLKPGDTVVVP